MTRVKILVGATLLCAASIASAQDAPDPAAPPPDGSAAPAPAPAAGDAAPAPGGEIISEPLTLGKGVLGLTAGFEIARLTVTVPPIPPATTPMTVSATAEELLLGGGYGINEKLEVGATYALDLHDDSGTFPNSGKGPLAIYGGYSLMSGKLSIAAGADFSINLGNTDDKAIHAGLAVRYMVAPKIAIVTGNPVPPGPAGQHLSISLASNGPITFALPVGVEWQAAPKAFVYLNTELASFSISNSSNAFLFSDFIPLDVGLLYRAAPGVDVGAHFSDDLKNAGDFYVFGVMLRYMKA